ncbi:MAG TPA: GDSL-type esterase/lipase family protein [Cryobacterium sp.]|nr:GDSL-type esterase/lipase family protein [Cryobacterium sp.]
MSSLIVFAGDGLTSGGRWDEWFPDYQVHNMGVNGDTTDETIAKIDDIVALDPDAVVLQIGTNDLGWRRSDEYVVRNIETILVTLRKRLPQARILVQSLLPRESDFADTIRSINRHLWQFAPTQHAQFLDLWPAMAQPNGELIPAYTTDHLHLTEEGYTAWLSELKPALETLFEQPPTSTKIPIQHI